MHSCMAMELVHSQDSDDLVRGWPLAIRSIWRMPMCRGALRLLRSSLRSPNPTPSARAHSNGLRFAQPYATIGIRQPCHWVEIANPRQEYWKQSTDHKNHCCPRNVGDETGTVGKYPLWRSPRSGRRRHTGICLIRVCRRTSRQNRHATMRML